MVESIKFIDLSGACGSALHYSLVISFVGGAFLIFLYLWRKNALDMDESPKFQMMESEEEDKHEK